MSKRPISFKQLSVRVDNHVATVTRIGDLTWLGVCECGCSFVSTLPRTVKAGISRKHRIEAQKKRMGK